MQSKTVGVSGVDSLSTTVEINFILSKLYFKKLTKKQLNVSKFVFCSMWKTVFFHLFWVIFLKVLYKIVLLSSIKVPYKSVLLSIITCRHSLLTYLNKKYFIKAFYLLSSKNVALRNLRIWRVTVNS